MPDAHSVTKNSVVFLDGASYELEEGDKVIVETSVKSRKLLRVSGDEPEHYVAESPSDNWLLYALARMARASNYPGEVSVIMERSYDGYPHKIRSFVEKLAEHLEKS